jgi:hypothetical protein
VKDDVSSALMQNFLPWAVQLDGTDFEKSAKAVFKNKTVKRVLQVNLMLILL